MSEAIALNTGCNISRYDSTVIKGASRVTTGLNIKDILFESAIASGGSKIRISFDEIPNLQNVKETNLLIISGSLNSVNDGQFVILEKSQGTLLVFHPTRTDAADDETNSPAVSQCGIDTHIVYIFPVGAMATERIFTNTIIFNTDVNNITIANSIDDTVLRGEFAEAYADTDYKYDKYNNSSSFPGNVVQNLFKLEWKYFYSKYTWVRFTINYEILGVPYSYDYYVYNQNNIKSGSYILPKDKQP